MGEIKVIKMEGKMVDFHLKVDESKSEELTSLLNELSDIGVQIVSISKKLTIEDLGLSQLDNGHWQCLQCSKTFNRKHNAVAHFKKFHTNQAEPITQCPRCNEEMSKSKLNPHMESKHGIKKFDQVLKRNFLPGSSDSSYAKEKIPKLANVSENNDN